MNAIIINGRFEYRPVTTPPALPQGVFSKTFEGRPGLDFSALNDALDYLTARGFCVGPGCAASRKAAIMFGNWKIAKWRNLTPLEQARSHGVLEGERRTGPVTLRIFFTAPPRAIAAVSSPQTAQAVSEARHESRKETR